MSGKFDLYPNCMASMLMMSIYLSSGTYYAAVIENRADFTGRVVVDVGAGSGILSLFAAQVHFVVQ